MWRRVWYYFRQDTNKNQPPDDPVCPLDVFDKYASSNQLQRNCIRLGSNMPNVLVGLEGGMGENMTTNQDSDRKRTPKTKRERGTDNIRDNSAPAPIEITPGRTPCGGKETLTGTADVVLLGVEVPYTTINFNDDDNADHNCGP